MKILMVNKYLYPRGGSESYMLKLGNHLSSLGHEVQYFGMFDEKNTVGNKEEAYTQNMDFHSAKIARFLYPFKIIFSLEAKKKIGQVLDNFKPDIVHMNNINFQLTPSIIYAVKKRGIPLVQTVHDYQMICPNHLLYSFKENKPCDKCINGSKWNCLKNSCIHDSKVKSLLGVIEAKLYQALKTYKKVDLFICPSFFLENKLLKANDFYKGKTYTIHNFIEKREKPDFSAEENKPYIVFVGRLSKEKGIENLKEVAMLLGEYEFVVVGNGPDEDILKNIDNIKLKGFLTGSKLTEIMANAKALIAPSVCYENCPLSILEAHSMGVPVITMNSGGMAELVKDSVTGILAESPEPSSIAQAVRKLMEDEESYNFIKENCEKEKDNILSVEAYCDILLKKYDEIIYPEEKA